MRNLDWAEEEPSGEMEGTFGDLPNFVAGKTYCAATWGKLT